MQGAYLGVQPLQAFLFVEMYKWDLMEALPSVPKMPRQPTVSETRLKNLAAYLTPALALLDEITDAFGSSFIQPISKTTLSLFTTGKNGRRNTFVSQRTFIKLFMRLLVSI
ncbi:hypothetical protein B0H13DRAFT_2315299 [Mycena leptocephala]|nr:hypothetical protein B0H13DRAFT_2315299 [Mycena leptocephala]